ncbi:hypothetical protein DFQ28_003950 [Apophysomyces sp. BC1034]|nr:hypothetical protein DFQ30_003672 [Apophysomyces sp. BC1015]KAG0178659.1 hypothetical protein DFQ29_003194 [Apophysomyces sp. BC1021]KAG0189050.1 hypothetical protein DFQ28_003950 [Apophysomyces sp. BC1034]
MSLSPSSFETAVAKVDIAYRLPGQSDTVRLTDKLVWSKNGHAEKALEITSSTELHSDKTGHILKLQIRAHEQLELVHFEAKYSADLTGQRMLANGFQSWSQAREMEHHSRIPAIRSSVAWYTQFNLQGDYDFFEHSGEKGQIHSSSYTHFRDVKNNLHFFGSLSEDVGYTYFRGDYNTNIFSIYKDVLGKQLAAGQVLEFRVLMVETTKEDEAWDIYASFFEDKRALKGDTNLLRHVNGWTSWYNYYGDVSEDIVLQNVEALQKHKYPINIFQIDDGFQTAIGDWLSINSKFPSGMKVVASKIKQAGFMAGLWLAPYAVGFTSTLAKEHPDWLIKDGQGKPVVAGPNWGGFYALDMYHPKAREYLKEVFETVLNDWGFDMVKLDFCFAAAMIPRLGKSRGEIMWDAMVLIRELVGPTKLILGCGVPLASAWRKVDYCRIGSDVAPWWEDTKLKLLHVRERVSTANSLVSTLVRWPMSDRMFGNDPDVMILRNKKNKLKPDERYSLCVLNNILGALVFSSDNVAEYSPDEHLLYAATFPKVVARVQSVIEFRPDVFLIDFRANGRRYTTLANLSETEQKIYLPTSDVETHLLFATDNDMHMTTPDKSEMLFYHPSSAATLKVHETKTFLHIPLPSATNFLGSASHIVPGSEIDNLSQPKEGEIQLTFKKDNQRHHKVYLGVGEYLHETRITPPSVKINGVPARFEWIPVHGSGEGRPTAEVLAAVVEA